MIVAVDGPLFVTINVPVNPLTCDEGSGGSESKSPQATTNVRNTFRMIGLLEEFGGTLLPSRTPAQ